MFKSKIRWVDIKAIVLFTLAWPISVLIKHIHKNVWLFSERPHEARDNGYWLYRYTRKKHPEQKAYYVIQRNSVDRRKVEQYGKAIMYGSFWHYVMYLVVWCHISAHIDSDSPNSRVSNFLETHGLLKNQRVFLQHGITKDKISFGYYEVSRADLFVCAAEPEYRFCKKEFGYPEGNVQLLGFARFDGLNICNPERQVLLMPTWRAWLANVTEKEFIASDYFQRYRSLLANKRLQNILNERGVQLVFFPHSDMQKFISLFQVDCARVSIASAGEYEMQELLNKSAALITDYSSVAFDMAYMGRPICYYQFDYGAYRKGQHPEGYYSYKRDGFGTVCEAEDDLVDIINMIIDNNFHVAESYKERQNKFFVLRDKNNCERIYAAIRKLNEKE